MGISKKIEKIHRDIKKSGYPLEISVLKILLNTNWTIIPQYVYEDPDEKKQRTVDFVCYQRFELKSKLYTGFRVALFIECKTIEKHPWVLFTIKKPEDMSNSLNQFGYLKIYQDKRLGTTLYIDKLIKNIHYFEQDRYSINHYIAFSGRDGKDNFYEALNQSLKSLFVDKETMSDFFGKFDVPKVFLFSISYPIIICDKELYDYNIENDEITSASHIQYKSSGVAHEGASLIDVIKLCALPAFLKRIDEEILSLKEASENM